MKAVAEVSLGSDAMAPDERHRLVLPHVARGSRVALLDPGEGLRAALAAAECEVLQDPLELGPGADHAERLARLRSRLREFGPAKVILLDALARSPAPLSLLRAVAESAPSADLLIGFANASSANAILRALCGEGADGPALPDDQVRDMLAACGLSRSSREFLPARFSTFLARDAEAALRQLFKQLNPSTADDWILYVARHSSVEEQPAPARLQDGLLSVVIRNHTVERLELLDQALFSLACQEHHPLEIVVATQAVAREAADLLSARLEKHRPTGEYTYRVVHLPSEQDIRARLLNAGVAAASGRYLAFLDDDDVVYPSHYRELIGALRGGTTAWAYSRVRSAHFSLDPTGALYCKSKGSFPAPDDYSLADLVRENFIPCHSYVLDRARLARFPIEFSEQVSRCEDYLFLLRLAASFRPAALTRSTCEYRIRDDGSNSNMMGAQPDEARQREEQEWQMSRAIKEGSKRTLRLLPSMAEFDRSVRDAHDAGRREGVVECQSRHAVLGSHADTAPALRHRIVDGLNAAVKRIPFVHGPMKRVISRLLRQG